MMLESGRIRLVRPSAVSITHKKLAYEPTLENFIHKDRRRNVGCVHHTGDLGERGKYGPVAKFSRYLLPKHVFRYYY
jgi:hypothetical protein